MIDNVKVTPGVGIRMPRWIVVNRAYSWDNQIAVALANVCYGPFEREADARKCEASLNRLATADREAWHAGRRGLGTARYDFSATVVSLRVWDATLGPEAKASEADPLEAQVQSVFAAVKHMGLRPDQLQELLTDWLADRIDNEAEAIDATRIPQESQVRHLLRLGMHPARIVAEIEDYLTP